MIIDQNFSWMCHFFLQSWLDSNLHACMELFNTVMHSLSLTTPTYLKHSFIVKFQVKKLDRLASRKFKVIHTFGHFSCLVLCCDISLIICLFICGFFPFLWVCLYCDFILSFSICLGVIQKPRGHNSALFWPPTYLSGHFSCTKRGQKCQILPVVCVSTPKMYPQSGYFLVIHI